MKYFQNNLFSFCQHSRKIAQTILFQKKESDPDNCISIKEKWSRQFYFHKRTDPPISLFFQIGFIGGSGLNNPQILENSKEVAIDTPYGAPSDVLIQGTIQGIDCVILARHGRQHTINPSNVNYRANIWALKSVGCTHVVVSTATGSLQEDIQPGDLVILDSFIDRYFIYYIIFVMR